MADWVCHSGSTVFLFHRVLPVEERCFEPELSTNLNAFSKFLDWLGRYYEVLPLDELVGRRKEKQKPKLPLCSITFDDGWIDNYCHAFPELLRRNMPATIFLPMNFIGTQRRFWQELVGLFFAELQSDPKRIAVLEQVARRSPWFPPWASYREEYGALRRLLLTRPGREAQEFGERLIEAAGLSNRLPERAFVNWDEIKEMQRNRISFGSHTMNHTILTNAPPAAGEEEILASRKELEVRLGQTIFGFAYPWGAVGRHSLEQLRLSGYQYAVTVRPGVVKRDSAPFLLPRIPISDSILNGGFDDFSAGKVRVSLAKNILQHSAQTIRTPGGRPSKKVKIIFLVDLITEWEGGTERQLHLLIQSLDQRYFEPKLCFLFESPELDPNTIPCPLIVINQRHSSRFFLLRRFLRLVRVLSKEHPDIVQTFFVEGNLTGVLAARLAGVPNIIGSIRNAGTWQSLFHRLVFRLITPLANRWQTNSRALWCQQFHKTKVLPDRIDILPNGNDLSQFRPSSVEERMSARRTLGLDAKGLYCLLIANFTEVKDIPTLLQGARILRTSLPNCQFILVGDGDQRAQLEKQTASLERNGSVRFFGRQADVRPFLAAADVGVLTSRSEGSSNAVIEYMAAGLPAVLSRIEPNQELAQGLFFTPGDAVDLAEQINLLANNDQLCALLSSQNQRMAKEFDVERFKERVNSYYGLVGSHLS